MSISIDVGIYWRQKQPTLDWHKQNARGDINYTISSMAPGTHLPCIIIACWLGEEYGFDEQLIRKIKSLIKFYGYRQILGIPSNWPEDLTNFLET